MYYTSSGNLINNPLAYSKTGAPMYKATNSNETNRAYTGIHFNKGFIENFLLASKILRLK